jgi:hypothetical protein
MVRVKRGLTLVKVMKDVGARAYDNYPTVKDGEVVTRLQAEEERMPSVDEDKTALRWAANPLNMQHVQLMVQTQEPGKLLSRR